MVCQCSILLGSQYVHSSYHTGGAHVVTTLFKKNVEKKTLFRFFGDIELVQGHAVGAHNSGRLRLGQLWLKGQYHAVPLPTKLAGNRLDGGQRIADRGSGKSSGLLSKLR